MTIIVTGRKLEQGVAEDAFRDAGQYLRQSRFAAFVLNELMTVPQLLHIEVTSSPARITDAWRPPRKSEPNSAGHLLWNLAGKRSSAAAASAPSDIAPIRVLAHGLGQAYCHLAGRAAYLCHLNQAMRQQLERLDMDAIDNILALQLPNKAYCAHLRP
jgi:hypothetical protein